MTSGTERSFHSHRSTLLFAANFLGSDCSQADDQRQVLQGESHLGLAEKSLPGDKLGRYRLGSVAAAPLLRLFAQEEADPFPCGASGELAAVHGALGGSHSHSSTSL